MLVVYVIGPFRAKTKWQVLQNVQVAEQLGLEVAKLGAMPIIPHKNTENFDGLLADEFWLEGTKELLDRCDAAITVEAIGYPWRHSVGSTGEVNRCRETGKPVFHDLQRLDEWIAMNVHGKPVEVIE